MTQERINIIRNQFKFSSYPLNVMSEEMLKEIEEYNDTEERLMGCVIFAKGSKTPEEQAKDPDNFSLYPIESNRPSVDYDRGIGWQCDGVPCPSLHNAMEEYRKRY